MKFNGNELLALGYPEGKVIGIILSLVKRHFADQEEKIEQVKQELKGVLAQPEAYEDHDIWGTVAAELLRPKEDPITEIKEQADPYAIYGKDMIGPGALRQIEMAMRLPIAIGGALMPDAHQGYGLPIGGVLATRNEVIPYGVGVDIGCRMCMTIYELPASMIDERKSDLRKLLIDNTRFGKATFKEPIDHEVLESRLFQEIPIVKELKDRAWRQIGTSGGGNHFVEFGIADILDPDNEFGLAVGQYLAVLSHSGSRGMGAKIAGHYTKVAMEKCKLPKEARHLAWLNLDTEEGQEYWLAMNLAGDYASACHHQIHDRMAKSLGAQPLQMIENHHNFAWKEKDADGNDIIVHRKGATPAGKGVLGIIPGSMTAPGFIVRGKGNVASVNSASHGAGRVMSRTQAKNTLDKKAVSTHIQEASVEVIGSGLDEAPMAYKNIHEVMEQQKDLVEIVGSFQPRIVRMCGDETFQAVD